MYKSDSLPRATVPGKKSAINALKLHAYEPLILAGHDEETIPREHLLNALAAVLISLLARLITEPIPSGSDLPIEEINDKPVVAVLPFKNISNDPDQDYLSDGMTADLITDLSKVSGLAVIARNSVFAFTNSDVDIPTLGAELGVHYVIEGSVRKAGDTVRISARLIDADKGYNLWADRFDGKLENVFTLQDEVTAKIVPSLEVKLTENERVQLAHKYTNSSEAYDIFLHDNAQAIDYFTQALERNPEAQESRLWLAAAYAHMGRSEDARWELEEIRIADANLSIERLEQVIPFKDLTQRKHLTDGLYKAGLH